MKVPTKASMMDVNIYLCSKNTYYILKLNLYIAAYAVVNIISQLNMSATNINLIHLLLDIIYRGHNKL